jgi:hypothetical protein
MTTPDIAFKTFLQKIVALSLSDRLCRKECHLTPYKRGKQIP